MFFYAPTTNDIKKCKIPFTMVLQTLANFYNKKNNPKPLILALEFLYDCAISIDYIISLIF